MKTLKLLAGSQYTPGLGGHAPGDVRDAWCDLVDAVYCVDWGQPLPEVSVRGRSVSARALLRLLWNCTDIVPSAFVSMVQEMGCKPQRATYGAFTQQSAIKTTFLLYSAGFGATVGV